MLVSFYLEILLILMQDRSMICTEHTTGSEIILEAADGTLSDVGHVESRFGMFGDSVSVSIR
jgi:hypothetical protein